jgi:hypothetical protein
MNSKYKNKIYLQEFQKWINTDGYIGYVGCSFTWGQGLWNYDKDNLDTPTYQEYIFQNIEPTKWTQETRKKLRYPNLLSKHFGADSISKEGNGGSDIQSLDILNDVLNSRSQSPEMKGKWPLEKMKLLVFQHSAVSRCSSVFKFKGKQYIIELQGDRKLGNNDLDGIWELNHKEPWTPTLQQKYLMHANPEDKDSGRWASKDIFFDYLIDKGIGIDEYWYEHCRYWLREVQRILGMYNDLGIPIVCWHWERDLIEVIHEEEFEWIRSITMPLICEGKSFPFYMEAAHTHKNLYIRDDEEANRYPTDSDEHPSKWGHEVITSSIIDNLRQRGITI